VGLDWGSALEHTLIPSFSFGKDQIFLLCAILGTTISPYLFFWQTSQEVEEHRHTKSTPQAGLQLEVREAALRHEIRSMRVDVWTGMFFSNAVMFFIMAATAATLYMHGITDITTASQAAEAIRPFGGVLTYFFFTVGIIGTGLLAIPVLAGSSAYAIAESFGWKSGLYYTLKQAYAFYGVIIISGVIGVIANLFGLDPIRMLIYSAVGNGLVAPVVLYFIVRLSSTMRHHRNHRFITLIGWATTGLMTLSGVAAVCSLFF
jgi:Mn2+/Fe2+ NRAMP family transporter